MLVVVERVVVVQRDRKVIEGGDGGGEEKGGGIGGGGREGEGRRKRNTEAMWMWGERRTDGVGESVCMVCIVRAVLSSKTNKTRGK